MHGSYVQLCDREMTLPARSAPARATRRYQSQTRTQGAADTRRKILHAAKRLFVERGFGKVALVDIAAEASVALPTLYANIGSKTTILSTLVDEALEDPITAETISAIRKSRSAEDIIAITARGTRIHNERHHAIMQAVVMAAAVDDTATEILLRLHEQYRQALGPVARRLRAISTINTGLTNKQANDVVWFYFGREAWYVLAGERRWSWDTAERWLAAQACTALIGATSI
jgi:AcrR family transcriptional regulator